MDLQQLALCKIFQKPDIDFWSKLNPEYFSGFNQVIYNKIRNFYKNHQKLPSLEEFRTLKKDLAHQDYLEKYILSDEHSTSEISDQFIIEQLQDYYCREETIKFLDKFVDNLDKMETVEILDEFQVHLLKLNSAASNQTQIFDVTDIETFPEKESFIIYPSGLSHEFDATNGGFALSESVLLGGRRGSGKSILALNAARHRYELGHSVAYFSIEMRYKEQYDRLMSQISRVPFLDIYRSKLTDDQKWQIASSKVKFFYKPEKELLAALEELKTKKNWRQFDLLLKAKKSELKDNRFIIIDNSQLTLNRLDHHLNEFKHKLPNFTLAGIDYLNIVSIKDQRDWIRQIEIADFIKQCSRKFELTTFTPYQIDASGEARFAKGILDSADKAFTFFPPEKESPNKIKLFTAKIRNGREINVEIEMDWACVRIVGNSALINESLLPGEKYGSEGEKQRDIPL